MPIAYIISNYTLSSLYTCKNENNSDISFFHLNITVLHCFNDNNRLNVLLKQSSLLCKQLEVHVNCLEMVQTCCVVCAFVYKIPPSSHCLFMFMFIPWFDLILFRSSITLKGLFTSKHNMHLNKIYHRNKDQLKGEEEGGGVESS